MTIHIWRSRKTLLLWIKDTTPHWARRICSKCIFFPYLFNILSKIGKNTYAYYLLCTCNMVANRRQATTKTLCKKSICNKSKCEYATIHSFFPEKILTLHFCGRVQQALFKANTYSRIPRNSIKFPKLFWPSVRKNCSSDQDFFFETRGWRHFEIIQTVKDQDNFW